MVQAGGSQGRDLGPELNEAAFVNHPLRFVSACNPKNSVDPFAHPKNLSYETNI
jgi:hypothetical protein